MALINAFTPTGKNADLLISSSDASLGFHFAEKTNMVEGRASTFTDNLNSGGTTYKDASPFARAVFDNWIGGLGQQSYNKTFGGTGVGGDDTRYMDAEAYTLRTGYFMPGMARNLVYNTITAARTPISDGIDGFVGSSTITDIGGEYEVPRGVVPIFVYGSGSATHGTFTASATVALTNIRVLVYFGNVPTGSLTIDASLTAQSGGGPTFSHFAQSVSVASVVNQTGWKWITLARTSGTGVITNTFTNTLQFNLSTFPTGLIVAFGGYAQDVSTNDKDHTFVYYQLMTSATPSKYWSNPPIKFEQLLNGTAYVNIALNSTSLWNTALTNSGGTVPATSPERLLTGTFRSSIVVNNELIVFTSSGVMKWNAADAAANATATQPVDAGLSGYSPVWWAGNIYFVGTDRLSLYKWNGLFPATPTLIMNANSVGQSGSQLNSLFTMGGFLHVIKPEGVYQLFQKPGDINIVEPVTANELLTFPTVLTNTGKWYVIHQQMLYVNFNDTVYQCAFNSSSGTQISIIKPDFSRYRINSFHLVNGLTSDGRTVYVSWSNLGVYAFSGQSWHKMMEFYETAILEGQSSGLRWLPNPTSAPDNLFCGDGRTLVQMPNPNAYTGISNQIFANHVNKCGYVITSLWDGDVAEITKYLHSMVIRAKANGYRYKIVPFSLNGTDTVSDANFIEKSFAEGPFRDSWISWTAINSQPSNIVSTMMTTLGVPIANTLAPTYYLETAFNSVYYSVEKLAVQTNDTTSVPPATAILSNPSKFVETGFIFYFWNPTPAQHSTTGQEVMAVDSVALKYLPILDYIPTYQCTIDFSSLVDENISATTTSLLGTYVAQLRAWGGRHSPVTIQFSDGYSGTNGVKTVNVLLRDIRFEYDPTVTRDEGGDPLPKRAFLSMVGIDAEYQGT